jgi:hypothetical protein
MVKKNTERREDPVVIKTKPGSSKDIGGGESEHWNFRQMSLLVSALPGVNSGDKKNAGEVGSAVVSGLMDHKPKDPIEGMLASQIVVAHEAALDMYRRAWSQPPEYFEARCRYFQMADRAKRTSRLHLRRQVPFSYLARLARLALHTRDGMRPKPLGQNLEAGCIGLCHREPD